MFVKVENNSDIKVMTVGDQGPPGPGREEFLPMAGDINLDHDNSFTIFNNASASGPVSAFLDPADAEAPDRWSFRVQNADGITVTATDGYIYIGTDRTLSISSVAIGSILTIEVQDSGNIFVTLITGSWDYDAV